MKKRTAGDDVFVANEEVFPLLVPGQHVDTPLGPGVITDIEIHAGRYGDRIEMEPPAVMVELDDESANPRRIQVCMCKLGLENGEHETIISKEFGRLWPPVTDEIPESAHQLVDMEETEGAQMHNSKMAYPSSIRRHGRTYILDRTSLTTAADDTASKYADDYVFEQLYDALNSESAAAQATDRLRSSPEFEELESAEQEDVVTLLLDEKIATANFTFDRYEAYADLANGDSLFSITSGTMQLIYCPMKEQLEALAIEVVERDLQQGSDDFSVAFLEDHVDMKALKDHLWDDIRQDAFDDLDSMPINEAVAELQKYGFDITSAIDDESAEDVISEYQDDYADAVAEEQLADPLSYLEDRYGRREAMRKIIIDWGYVDERSAASAAVEQRGAGYFLSPYDGFSYSLMYGAYWRVS